MKVTFNSSVNVSFNAKDLKQAIREYAERALVDRQGELGLRNVHICITYPSPDYDAYIEDEYTTPADELAL